MRHVLDNLSPEGLELKIHMLRRLLDSAPEPLSVSEAMEGGPNRTDASGWYAMKALERIGVVTSVPKTAECRVARYCLADGEEMSFASLWPIGRRRSCRRRCRRCLPVRSTNRCSPCSASTLTRGSR
ncbi:hypothetical protein GCM10022267_74440 [Lentzea roselyniae]|uniref:Uncharacterized protein n=1 Tax=Lentzea roselyniae TaxID=531940 RepID=A0ABP7C617_9PSEU